MKEHVGNGYRIMIRLLGGWCYLPASFFLTCILKVVKAGDMSKLMELEGLPKA